MEVRGMAHFPLEKMLALPMVQTEEARKAPQHWVSLTHALLG